MATGGLDHVLGVGRNVNIAVSTPPGLLNLVDILESDAARRGRAGSPRGSRRAQRSGHRQAIAYGNVYVATCNGRKPQQTLMRFGGRSI